ncbi:MAG: alpha-L-fucosidase [Pirellulales bacterium]|nr:alpha-L-fucosidase [Pirellulales bacterium]
MQRRRVQLTGLMAVGLVLVGLARGVLADEAVKATQPAEPASTQPASDEPWQPAGIAGILPIGSWRKPLPEVTTASPEDIAAWRKLKFGLFIHWGPVSVQGTEIGWSRAGYRRGLPWNWNILSGQVPVEIYDNLHKKFNPTKFDAREWVQIAKDAGTKYVVFTTKHHDGFCLFDTKLTDYKITGPESPYGRDIVRQLADACHEGGILWGIYYSQVDWWHPDYMNSIDGHRRYLKYLHGQMRELLTGYGKVSMIFFDGLSGDEKDWDGAALVNMCRELQPGVIINDRAGVPADNSTPEQRIGHMDTKRPWETCMTIGTQWSWKPNDRIKSFKECIQTLVRVVGGDGNLLFNVGPMPDGRIEPRQADRLREMGRWLAKYGESIYDTRGGPFRTDQWGAATWRGKTVYVHVLDGGKKPVTLEPIDRKIVSHRVLTGGQATVVQTDKSVTITLSDDARNDVDAIVVLELDGPVRVKDVSENAG